MQLGARLYDPTLGRFVSVDVVLAPDNPQQNNGYSYAGNDPVTVSDPTGACYRVASDSLDHALGCIGGSAPNSAGANGSTTGKGATSNDYKAPAAPGKSGSSGAAKASNPWSWAASSQRVLSNLAMQFDMGIAIGEAVLFAASLACDLYEDVCESETETLEEMDVAALSKVGDDFEAGLERDEQDIAGLGRASSKGLSAAVCGGESFTAGTLVVLAGGSSVAISQVRVGDKVEAVDTATGESVVRTVSKVWVNHDTDLMDVTVADASGKTSTIHATRHHLFWDVTQNKWVGAEDLPAGDRLQSDDGSTVTAVGQAIVPGAGDMWDLTVVGAHDFYIQVGATILVHNDDCPSEIPSIGTSISSQKQARHIQGNPLYQGGGYFKNEGDAQDVLDAYHSGDVTFLGKTRGGNVLVRYDAITGYNNNPRAGFVDQPTNVFMIKGTKSVSVVPYSPQG